MLRFDRNDVFLLDADEEGRRKMRKYIEDKHGFCNVILLTRSILSRELECYSIGEGDKIICIFAAHHALESITTNLAYLMICALLSGRRDGYVNDIDCKLLLSKYRYLIVPCVNPDGIELRLHGAEESPLRDRQLRMSGSDFSLWQANARGVDLNHNYRHRFEEYKAKEGELGIVAGHTLYSGEYPESEPETRGVGNLIRTVSPWAVVSLHSQGEEIYAYPDTASVTRTARRLSAITAYKLGLPSGTAAYGGLCDYTASLGIPSFTYEVGRGVNPLPNKDVFPIFERIAESVFLLPTLL